MSEDPPDGPPPSARPESKTEEPPDTEPDAAPDPPDDAPPAVTESGADVEPDAFTTATRTLDTRVRWLWVARSIAAALFVGGLAIGIALFVASELLAVGAGVFVVAALLGVAHALLLYRTWEYQIRDDSMYLDRGVVTRVQTVVPYVRVQHIDTSRGPIERTVGLSSLVVYTAGSRGADVTIPGLTPEEAADLQSRLKALAIESEGEDAV